MRSFGRPSGRTHRLALREHPNDKIIIITRVIETNSEQAYSVLFFLFKC